MKMTASTALASSVLLLTIAVLHGCADPLAQGRSVEQVAARQRATGQPVRSAEPKAPSVRPAELADDDLVAYYPFDGNVTDASGHGNDGKTQGKLCFVDGVAGQAVRFPGGADGGFVRVPNTDSLKFDRQLTVACWVRLLDWDDRDGPGKSMKYNHQVFFGKSTDVTGFVIYAHSWTRPAVGIVSDNHTPRKAAALPYTDAVMAGWMHLAVACDADGIRVYHDGKLVKTVSKPVDFAAANTCDMTIGRQGNGYAGTMNGLMDELRIYRRALAGREVARLAGRRR